MTFSPFSNMGRRLLFATLLIAGTTGIVKADDIENGPWYVGAGVGTSFGQCTFRSITEHSAKFGVQGGLFGGYRLNQLISFEAGLQLGRQNQTALDCCPYWMSESGERHMSAVSGQNGWPYSDLSTKTGWAKLAFQTNFNLLSLFGGANDRWAVNASPQISAVTTSTTLVTPDSEIDHDRQWHMGLGAQASVGRQITDRIGVALFGGITCLTGQRFDNIPEHMHKSNLIWDTGVKVCLTLPRKKQQAPQPAPVPTPVIQEPEPEPIIEPEPEAPDTAAIQAAAREAARQEAARQAAIAKEEAFNTPIPTVYFANNSYLIDTAYVASLMEAVEIMNRYDDFQLEIHTYCSQSGEKEYNDYLSKVRMEQIRTWFIEHGIPVERMGRSYYHGVDYDAPNEASARRAEIKFVK